MATSIAIAGMLGLAAAGGMLVPATDTQGSIPLPYVGVVYAPPADPVVRRRDLEEMARLRFSIVVPRGADDQLLSIDRLLAGTGDPQPSVRDGTPAVRVEVVAGREPARVSADAWLAVARGARSVVFEDWTTLTGDAGALAAAADFAAHLFRNAALYAPLRPRTASQVVRVLDPGSPVEAAMLESPDALVVIAVNRRGSTEPAELRFSPEVPEAIWQNMLTGGSVNFVAGPDGPAYPHTFAPHGVLVLMIQKKWR